MTLRHSLVPGGLILLVLLTAAVVADDIASTRSFYERGVRGALARSPDHFIAALVRRASAPVCNVDGLDGCFAQYRVEELMAYKAEALDAPPKQFNLLCGADLGPPRSTGDDLALVLAIPLISQKDVYGAAFMTATFSPDDRKRFKQIVADVLEE